MMIFRKWPLMNEAGTGSAGGASTKDTGAGATGATGATGTGAGSGGAGAGTGGTGTGGTGATVTTWPDTWRTTIAGQDQEAVKRLERFQSPADIWKSYRALEQRVSSGELKSTTPFPAKGTAEEQTAWRQQNGIPDAPDKYDLKFDNGLVIGEDDKPIIDSFLKSAHAENLSNAAVKAAVGWYYEEQKLQQEALAEQTAQQKQQTEDTLRTEMGADYRRNMSAVQGLLDANVGADSKLKTQVLESMAVSVEFSKLMTSLALQINPLSTLTGGGLNPDAVQDEIAALEKKMGNRSSDYWKGPTAEKQQQRYRELVAARDRNKK